MDRKKVAVLAVVGVLVLALGLVGTASAQTAITDCKDGDADALIDSSGTYVLQNDVSNDSTCIEITADDVVLDGAGNNITAVGSPGENAVVAENVTNVTVTNLRADGWDGGYGGAVRFVNVTDGEVSGVESSDSRIPFRIDSSSGVDITDNTASDTTNRGIRVIGDSSGVTVAGNKVMNTSAQGIDIDPSSVPTERFVVRDNVFNTSGGSASLIVLRSSNAQADVINNTLLNSGARGVYSEAPNTRILDNYIENNMNEDGILLTGASDNVTVAGNEVIDTAASAIDLQPSSPPTERFVIRDNTFDGSATGVSITAIREETLFVNNTLLNSGDHGVYVQSASDTVVRDNNVTNSADSGIILLDSSTNVTVEDNEVSNSGSQSLLMETGSDETTVRNNLFESNGGGVSSVDVFSNRNVLVNNTVLDSDGHGFYVPSNDNVIRDNNATLSQINGILLTSSSFNTTVKGNYVADPITGDGIRIDSSENRVVGNEVTGVGSGKTGIAIVGGGTNSNVIAGNTVFDNYQGMYVEGADHTIQDNTVTGSNGGSDGNGVRITTAASNATVDDNLFLNNDNDGVKIEDSSDHTVTDNTANGNGASGVATVGSSSLNTIENNTANGNRDGIYINGADNTVLSNTAENSDEVGIEIRPGASGTTLVENTARGNPVDFDLEGSIDNTVERLTVGASTAPDATLTFDARDIEVRGVSSPPADPSDARTNAGAYFNATETSASGYLNVSARYDATGIREETLSLYRFDEVAGEWGEVAGTKLDTGADTVTANITNFSTFGVFGKGFVDRRDLSRGDLDIQRKTSRDLGRGELGERDDLRRESGRNRNSNRRDRGR